MASKKEIYTICLDCGKKHGKKKKTVFGVWVDNCDMCGAQEVPCAAAGHDFGIYNNDKEKEIDRYQI